MSLDSVNGGSNMYCDIFLQYSDMIFSTCITPKGHNLTYEDLPLLWLLQPFLDELPMPDKGLDNFHSRMSTYISVTKLYQAHFPTRFPVIDKELLDHFIQTGFTRAMSDFQIDLIKTMLTEKLCYELPNVGEEDDKDQSPPQLVVLKVPGVLPGLLKCMSRGQTVYVANHLYRHQFHNISNGVKFGLFLPLELFPFLYTDNFEHFLVVSLTNMSNFVIVRGVECFCSYC